MIRTIDCTHIDIVMKNEVGEIRGDLERPLLTPSFSISRSSLLKTNRWGTKCICRYCVQRGFEKCQIKNLAVKLQPIAHCWIEDQLDHQEPSGVQQINIQLYFNFLSTKLPTFHSCWKQENGFLKLSRRRGNQGKGGGSKIRSSVRLKSMAPTTPKHT
jgi:hypothetical protein